MIVLEVGRDESCGDPREMNSARVWPTISSTVRPMLCGAVAVDGEDAAFEVVGADHAERTFDELAVAGFALAEGGFGDALHGDVDAGGDDEGDLALGVDERGGGPGDAAEGAVAS